MKNFFIFTSLILSTSFTTFTMEKEHQKRKDFHWHSMDDINDVNDNNTTTASSTTPIPHDELKEFADQLNTAINKRCTVKDLFGFAYELKHSELKEKDFFAIAQIIDKYSKTYDFTLNNFIETFNYISKHPWYCGDTKNYLNTTILYFTDLAKKNFDGVTSTTLDIVGNANSLQSTPQLNRLPQYLRYYCMNNAYHKKIAQSYDIVLTSHTDNITCVDVHEATHRAATGNCDKTLHIWDLTTGKCLRTLNHHHPVNCITFNDNGSRFATAANFEDESSFIGIWDSQSVRLDRPVCYKEIEIPAIHSLSYKNNTLIACSKDNPPKIFIFSVKNNKIKEKELAMELSQQRNSNEFHQKWGDYRAIDPRNSLSYKATITITKKNCHKFCLYQQAIKNDALNFNVERIEATPFTEYEKGILHKLLIAEQTKQKI